jgi:hypothetical protein
MGGIPWRGQKAAPAVRWTLRFWRTATVLMRMTMALAFFLAGWVNAQAQEVSMDWKFAKGDKPFYQKLKTTTQQTIKIMGQSIAQTQEMDFTFSWTVKDVDPSKIVLVQKIEACAMKMNLGGNEVKYDSTAKDAAENPLSSFFKPILASEFTLTLDPATMSVKGIEGRESFAKKLADANPNVAVLLKSILSDEQLRQMQEPAFSVVPDKGKKVKPGDTWSRESMLSMGPIGSFKTRYDYTYKGTEKKMVDGVETVLQKIDLKSTLTYAAPDAKDAGGLPFKIEPNSKLDATEATGVIYFDAERGRVVESTMNVKLKGKLEIVVMDSKNEVDLEQVQVSQSNWTDKNPLEGAK